MASILCSVTYPRVRQSCTQTPGLVIIMPSIRLTQAAADPQESSCSVQVHRPGLLVTSCLTPELMLLSSQHLIWRCHVSHLCRLERDFDVAALDGQVEARPLVPHEVQRHLREALLLQVRDDGLARQPGAADHREHGVKLPLQQRQLEHVLGGVDLQGTNDSIEAQACFKIPMIAGFLHVDCE
jgi:hypothetical protein